MIMAHNSMSASPLPPSGRVRSVKKSILSSPSRHVPGSYVYCVLSQFIHLSLIQTRFVPKEKYPSVGSRIHDLPPEVVTACTKYEYHLSNMWAYQPGSHRRRINTMVLLISFIDISLFFSCAFLILFRERSPAVPFPRRP